MEWIIHDSLLKGLSLSQTGIYIVCHTPCWCTIFVHKRMEHKQKAGDFFFTSEGLTSVIPGCSIKLNYIGVYKPHYT